MKWRYSHERNRNNKFRHARIRKRRVVSADRGKRGHPRGCAAEGERNTEGENEMRIAKFREGQKVVGIGRDNKDVIGIVSATSVYTPSENKVWVKFYNRSGFLSWESGGESTWEVIG